MSVEVARMTNRSGRKRGGSRIAWWTTGGVLCVAMVLGGWPMHAADEPTPLAVSSAAKPDDAKTGAAAKSDSPASVDSAPASKPSGSATAAARHWCYQPIRRPALPAVQALEQVQNPIDQLILARLEKLGLKYSPEASRAELLRRLKFDLLGLPPTPEEQTEFANDRSPDAYERLVERFLSSPHYGEKWGRLWLDAVGYADTAGYNADPLRPLAYQYRDYVIAAFNRDLPFDQFVTQQIAGDELQPDNRDALIATGFLRMPPDESNASDVLLARQDQLNQITASVGAVLLGQSLGCAQCHDHKYDELTQRDFYSLQAFFAAVIPVDSLLTGDIATRQKNETVVQQWLAETAAVREARHQLLVNARKRAASDKRLRYQEIIWTALDTPREQRTAFQHQVCFFAERQVENDYKEKSTNSSGVVIRVFHPFARTEFEPSEQVAQALRASVRTAEQIEVRGHTDSNVVNPIDKLIAIERAEKARTWLINNGAEGSKIRTKYFTAGNFLVENKTPQGRSMNRRVEIDIRNQQLAGKNVASSN